MNDLCQIIVPNCPNVKTRGAHKLWVPSWIFQNPVLRKKNMSKTRGAHKLWIPSWIFQNPVLLRPNFQSGHASISETQLLVRACKPSTIDAFYTAETYWNTGTPIVSWGHLLSFMSYFKLTRPFPKHSFNDICQSIQFPKKEKRSQVTKVSPAVQFYNVGQNPRIQKTRIQYIAGDLIFFLLRQNPTRQNILKDGVQFSNGLHSL